MRRTHLFVTVLSLVLFSFASCKCNKSQDDAAAMEQAPAEAPAEAAPAPAEAPAEAAPAPAPAEAPAPEAPANN